MPTTVPPIVFMECPLGHYWPRIDPRWLDDSAGHDSGPDRIRRWCPDHQAERKESTAVKIRESRIRASRAYDRLPLPQTKRCTNQNATRHPVGEVKPVGDFYLRSGRIRSDGSRAVMVDSWCKDCCKASAAARRDELPEETKRQYQRNYRKNKRELTAGKRRKGGRQVDASLFLEWSVFAQPVLTGTERRMIDRAKADGNILEYWVIDAVMTRYGAADQLLVFYG